MLFSNNPHLITGIWSFAHGQTKTARGGNRILLSNWDKSKDNLRTARTPETARDRAGIDRDRAGIDRDRAGIARDRAGISR